MRRRRGGYEATVPPERLRPPPPGPAPAGRRRVVYGHERYRCRHEPDCGLCPCCRMVPACHPTNREDTG